MLDDSELRSARGERFPAATLRQMGVVAIIGSLVLVAECWRWLNPPERVQALTTWLCGTNADWLPYVPWLMVAPLFGAVRQWPWRRRTRHGAQSGLVAGDSRAAPTSGPSQWPRIWGGLLVVACSWMASWYVAQQFGPLPPAYHDEYSYLFQAETFRAGRVSFPGFEPMPHLFDQMHVLNEGRFASRYFPGTGLWIAVVGRIAGPSVGHWIAGMLVAWAVYQIGCELSGVGVGLLAGLLTAASPGLALFSNLLLAHHPTLVGLMLFIWQYCVFLRTGGWPNGLAAGVALTFAMLCRPMTAFGVALPFGACFGWWLLTGRPRLGGHDRDSAVISQPRAAFRQRIGLGLSFGAPLAAGFIALGVYNRAITGNPLLTPYQLYLDIYTPRHVYGFNNVIRGEQRLGPKVLENYDRWAENLTPSLAVRNIARRVTASLRWTLGIVPLAMGAVALLLLRGESRATESRTCISMMGWRLIGCAILTLHVVHVPYWFEGMMGWHYVFESAPLWLLLLAEGTHRQVCAWLEAERPAMALWWSGVIATAVAVNWCTVRPLWPGRLPDRIPEVAFSRKEYARFHATAEQIAGGRRAIVFVEPDPAARHIDFVINTPALDQAILYARYQPGRTDLKAARRLFPDRDAYLYRAASDEWERLP